MKAVTWHGRRDVRVDEVPDPAIQDATDCIVRITSTAICGSDLHLYEVFGPFLEEGDILGHEPMGVVEEVGPGVTRPQGRRPGGHPVQRLLRRLLDVRPGPALAVRDDPEPRPGHRRVAVRLHQALRAGPRRAGGVPARPVRRQAADQGARGAAGRALPLPLRRACPPRGRASSTPTCPTAERCWSSASARSATWPRRIGQHQGKRVIAHRPRARAARARPRAAASRRSTSGRSTTRARRCGR